MRKFTLFIASLFLALGAMAQTFVTPVTGGQYKIKGDSQSHPWLTANMSSGGNVVVSANETDAAVFEKTANGLKAVSTGKYLCYSGGKYTYSDTEITVELVNTGSQANSEGKYAIKSGGNWMYNNNTDGIVHESSAWLDLPRLWGFIEVSTDDNVLKDGVYTIQADENGKRGYLAISARYERPVLTEISWSSYSGNGCNDIIEFGKYWYVKTIDGVTYISNIGNGKFIYDNETDDIFFGETPYGLNVARYNNYIHVGSGTGIRYLSMGCGTTAPNQVKWEKQTPGDGGCLLTFTEVDATNYAMQIRDAENLIAIYLAGNTIAAAELAEAIAQAEALLAAITIGDGVSEYSGGGYTKEELVSLLGSAKEFYNSIDASTPVETIEAYIEFVNGTMASYSLNMPVAGKYYRFQGNSGNYIDASSIYNNATAKVGQMSIKSADACNMAGTIFYLDENGKLLNYYTGTYVTATREIANVGVAGNTWTFSASSIAGKYKIKSNDGNWLHDNSGNRADRCDKDPDGHSETHSWTIEPVVELPVTITAAGYATFYAPVAVNIPDGVKAYTVSVNEGGWADLEEIYISFSPNVGVVLAAEEGTYYLPISEDNTVYEGNALRGTVAATYITDDAYVLGYTNVAEEGQPEKKEVGFYTATKNQQGNTAWKNNSHKAYLPKTAGMNAASYSFRFGEGTTGISEVKGEPTVDASQNGEVKAIYDLTGRKVEAITAPGIYIVNGKKVLVK